MINITLLSFSYIFIIIFLLLFLFEMFDYQITH